MEGRVVSWDVNSDLGSGLTAIALALGIVGWRWVTSHFEHKREVLRHEARLAALEKEVPWLEIEDQRDSAEERAVPVLPILGIVLFSFSVGVMVFLLLNLPVEHRGLWVAPLPIALMGAGLAGFHSLYERPVR